MTARRRLGARLTAVITSTGRERPMGAEEAHARNVLAITRRIHTKSDRLRKLAAEAKRLKAELRGDRLELRQVLQRDSSIGVDDPRLEAAGKADAIDASLSRFEQVVDRGLDAGTMKRLGRLAAELDAIDDAAEQVDGGTLLQPVKREDGAS